MTRMGRAKAAHSAAALISLTRQPGTVISTYTSAGRMKISPTWRTVAEAPRASPAASTIHSRGRGCQSRQTRPATISASNAVSGMIDCSIWSW